MKKRDAPRPNAVMKAVMDRQRASVSDVARSLGVSRQHVYYLIDGRARFTAGMAVRFERAFGKRAEHLMRLQLRLDLEEARRAADRAADPDADPADAAGGQPLAEA
jgi:addiction module HigA family antidote